MSLPNSSTLTIDVRARQLEYRVAWLALFAAGLTPWLLTALEPGIAAAASAVGVAVVARGLRHAGWMPHAAHRLTGIRCLADGRWLLTDASSRTVEGLLVRSDARVVSRCVWLRWRTVGETRQRTHSLLLGPYDLPQAQLRRLIVALRMDLVRPEAARARRAA